MYLINYFYLISYLLYLISYLLYLINYISLLPISLLPIAMPWAPHGLGPAAAPPPGLVLVLVLILLPVACCLLPVACCLLPIAYCLLPVAYCLLPIDDVSLEQTPSNYCYCTALYPFWLKALDLLLSLLAGIKCRALFTSV